MDRRESIKAALAGMLGVLCPWGVKDNRVTKEKQQPGSFTISSAFSYTNDGGKTWTKTGSHSLRTGKWVKMIK